MKENREVKVDTMHDIEDGDLSPNMTIMYREGFGPRCTFDLSHRIIRGNVSTISLTKTELQWIIKQMEDNDV